MAGSPAGLAVQPGALGALGSAHGMQALGLASPFGRMQALSPGMMAAGGMGGEQNAGCSDKSAHIACYGYSQSGYSTSGPFSSKSGDVKQISSTMSSCSKHLCIYYHYLFRCTFSIHWLMFLCDLLKYKFVNINFSYRHFFHIYWSVCIYNSFFFTVLFVSSSIWSSASR